MSNVIEFPVIPRKPADHIAHEHQCIRCEKIHAFWFEQKHAVYCDCGAEMRPVEAK